MSKNVKILSLAFALSLLLSPLRAGFAQPAMPQEPEQTSRVSSSGEDLGYGMGSVLASMFYSPFKVTYAGLGLITSGLGYVFSGGNTEVANNILNPSVRGNYVVTPSHLRGEEPLVFVGPAGSIEPEPTQQASTPPSYP